MIESGRFATVDEVIGEGLRLVAEQRPNDEEKVAALRAAIQVGLDDIEHARYVTFDSSEDLRAHLDKLLSGAIDPG